MFLDPKRSKPRTGMLTGELSFGRSQLKPKADKN
jgi:hypothetical protein